MIRILFIDDDSQAHKILKMVLPEDYIILSATRGIHGFEMVKAEDPDLILLDINLPDISGFEVLKRVNSIPSSPPVVMLTGFSETDLVVQAIRGGACDFITKPYTLEKLLKSIREALSYRSKYLFKKETDGEIEDLIGESPAIRELKRIIGVYSHSNSSILITGETGTGKDKAAKIIHGLSRRKTGPFIAINCGAIPASLLETEIYGSEKGAFTGAVSRPGSFEQASGGTLFLDEIGEMHIYSQVKLLRILEDNEIIRIGGTKKIPIDVRIISATNKNLQEEVKNGTFRQDLLFRINILPIEIPPLRQRKEDIPILAAYFLQSLSSNKKKMSSSAYDRLTTHRWPGNIRELKNVIERAILLSGEEEIGIKHIILNG
ncbi:MAG: sigma-54 dependent transcriptional regulator [Spirochaetota bacterium]